jgi:hypothetical protein
MTSKSVGKLQKRRKKTKKGKILTRKIEKRLMTRGRKESRSKGQPLRQDHTGK